MTTRIGNSLLVSSVLLLSACSSQTDISFYVLVKSSNYAQDSDGQLTLLNYHFFSEIFLEDQGGLNRATLTTPGGSDTPFEYEDRGSNHYVEGGHFDSVEELDNSFPNGQFVFDIDAPTVRLTGERLELSGPNGETDIPKPILISLMQDGRIVSPLEIVPDQDLRITWSEYSNGRADPRGIVDDMIFVVVADCHGERLFHTGLPFQGEYMRYDASHVTIDSHALKTGQPYSVFVEFPHVVDSRVSHGVPGFTSYATATYLDLHTVGEVSDSTCPQVLPPMDTGQTDRMERR